MNYFTFYDSQWFWLFTLVVPLFLLYWRYWRQHLPTLTVASMPLERSATRWEIIPPDLLFLLRLLTLSLLILSLANPKSVSSTTSKIPSAGIDIIICADISTSMLIEDLKPNRLAALKTVLSRFVAGRSQDRIGLVLYAGKSINWCPLTKDYGFLQRRVNMMDTIALAPGTAVGLGLASGVNILRQRLTKSKIIILLTDGESNTGFIDPARAALLAKKYGIKVYTIGIGSVGMVPLPLRDMMGHKTYRYVPADLDEASLRHIAQQTGGSYFRAQDAGALQQIYRTIDALEKTPTGYKTTLIYRPQYRWFLFPALFLFLLEWVVRFSFFRTLV